MMQESMAMTAADKRVYQIAWRSKTTSYQGRGTTTMTLADARAWCKKLNEDWPDLDHWPDKVGEG